MNYKDIVMGYFNKDTVREFSTDHHREGFMLSEEFFKVRFYNSLKQYNYNEERAYDLFMTKYNLRMFNYFVEETYLLSQDKVTDRHIIIRKSMRDIHNELQYILNDNILS